VTRSPVDGSSTKKDLNTGDLVDTLSVTARADLTDAQWTLLEPLLPKGKKSGRPPKWSKRQLIDGIRWRTRVGSPWRDVPARYGPWQTIYGLFRRWQRDGTWARILTGLQARADAAGLITWDVSVTPPSPGRTSMRPERGKGGSAEGTTRRRCRGRACRPRVGTLPWWLDHQGAPGL
jgi:transposase